MQIAVPQQWRDRWSEKTNYWVLIETCCSIVYLLVISPVCVRARVCMCLQYRQFIVLRGFVPLPPAGPCGRLTLLLPFTGFHF